MMCCCCCKLETGGTIIGFYNLILSLLLFIASNAYIIFYFHTDCEKTKNDMHKQFFCSSQNLLGTSFFVILLCPLRCWTAYMCIKGTKNRNSTQMEPMLYMLGFVVCLDILILLFRFTGILLLALECYEFFVIYYLRKMFQEESEPTQRDNNDMAVATL